MKRRFGTCLIAATALFGLLCFEGFAYKLHLVGSTPVRWPVSKMTYRVNPNKGPMGCVAAIRRAAAAWSNVANSSFRFVYGGKTSATNHGVNDRRNLVNFGPLPDQYTLAENAYWYDTYTGDILDSDIQFNTNFRYSATDIPKSGCYDLQDIATHELGHSLSLADLYTDAARNTTMYGYCSIREVKKRTLTSDDIAGIRALYP